MILRCDGIFYTEGLESQRKYYIINGSCLFYFYKLHFIYFKKCIFYFILFYKFFEETMVFCLIYSE